MDLFHPNHAVHHPIQHLIHEALRHVAHHAWHTGGHPLVHPVRPAVHHATEGATFEDLEGRLLMSHASLHDAPIQFAQAATKATQASTISTTAKSNGSPGPVAIADPAVTDKSFTYKSFASDPLFGSGGPSINDISQGDLGDCYLLSVLSSVAKTDAALIRRVVTPNANGTYTVAFTGKTAVTVNADLATLPDGRPAYAQLGSGNSLWVALVEKAYADYANAKADSYTTIDGGWMGSAFSALGLKNTSTFSATSANALATLVQKDLKANDFVTMGTSSYVGVNSPLIGGHAYEINSVTVDKKGAVSSITLRNPWGNDLSNGGYVTVTPQQAFAALAGLAVSHA